jgi:type I restriction-modification system DNA methylase subunit
MSQQVLLEQTYRVLERLLLIRICENVFALRLLPKDHEGSQQVRQQALQQVRAALAPTKLTDNAYADRLLTSEAQLDALMSTGFTLADACIRKWASKRHVGIQLLGYLFEQSLADIKTFKEDGQHNLQQGGVQQDSVTTNAPSKRKKEGVYYTPDTITRYLVEQTIGVYLQEHPDALEHLTVLDPACGSGAFLNQAHSALQQQWHNAYEEGRVKRKDAELGGMFDYNPIENDPIEDDCSIVLRNLYGVDVNRESVDITKLALWLKTARPDRPLQNLDANITWGNSLIDDPAITADAFDWQAAFPTVMAAGGFDIILGNPPYIFARDQGFQDAEKAYFYEHYQVATYQINTYALFVERALQLLKPGGFLGFILPNTWLTIDSLASLRKLLLEGTANLTIINCDDAIFDDASVDTALLAKKAHRPPSHSVTGARVYRKWSLK